MKKRRIQINHRTAEVSRIGNGKLSLSFESERAEYVAIIPAALAEKALRGEHAVQIVPAGVCQLHAPNGEPDKMTEFLRRAEDVIAEHEDPEGPGTVNLSALPFISCKSASVAELIGQLLTQNKTPHCMEIGRGEEFKFRSGFAPALRIIASRVNKAMGKAVVELSPKLRD